MLRSTKITGGGGEVKYFPSNTITYLLTSSTVDVLGKPASLGAGGWGQEIILIILNDFLFDSVSVIIIFLSYGRAENICKSSVLKTEIGGGVLFLRFQF